jgi:SAM-dependent methyltransferase
VPEELMRRPARLGERHASMFRLASVASSYGNRPPYPEETIGILAGLVPSECRRVLDVGCGTGLIARPLAALVEEVDALDPSVAMLEVGEGLPGGDRANLSWMPGTAEEGALRPPYGLIVAATSFHWFQWDVVLPASRTRSFRTGCSRSSRRGSGAGRTSASSSRATPRIETGASATSTTGKRSWCGEGC